MLHKTMYNNFIYFTILFIFHSLHHIFYILHFSNISKRRNAIYLFFLLTRIHSNRLRSLRGNKLIEGLIWTMGGIKKVTTLGPLYEDGYVWSCHKSEDWTSCSLKVIELLTTFVCQIFPGKVDTISAVKELTCLTYPSN